MAEKLDEITMHVIALSDDEIGTILAALSECGDDELWLDLFNEVYGDDDCGECD